MWWIVDHKIQNTLITVNDKNPKLTKLTKDIIMLPVVKFEQEQINYVVKIYFLLNLLIN